MIRLALLSFYRSLARHKLYGVLNIGGLALGIAVFLILGLYVRFETGYETWLPHYRQIYMVQSKLSLPGGTFNGAYPATMAGLLEELKEDFPGTAGTRIRGGDKGGTVLHDGEATTEDVAQVDPSFLDIFELPLADGTPRDALATPSSAIISRKTAAKYFGSANPVGRTLTIAVDAPATYRVAGMFDDLPANSDLKFSILIPIPKVAPATQANWYQWGAASLATYLKFASPAQARAFEQKLPAFVERRAGLSLGPNPSKIYSLPLLPIADAHLTPPGSESASRKLTVVTLGIVGVLTLLIAIVNYVNLATARAGLRAREVAMRKVLGASGGALVRQFLGEAVLTVLLAALIGLGLAFLGLPFVNAASGLSLGMPLVSVVPALLILAVVVGVGAGAYPALVLSRFPAAAVLASARAPGGGRAGARVREALVVLQFGLAVAFLIGTVVLVAQTRYVRHVDLGFRRDGLLVVPSLADKRITVGQARSLLTAWRAAPGVIAVGVAGTAAGGDGDSAVDVIEMPGQTGPGPSFRLISVGRDFFRAYAPRLLAGRVFSDSYATDDSSDTAKWNQGRNIVINRKAVSALGFRSPEQAVGKTVGLPRPRTIVGVIDELRFFSARQPDEPTYYIYYRDLPPSPVASIRYSGDPRDVLAGITGAWRQLAPDVPLVAGSADSRLATFYRADDQIARLFGIGTVLAVLIACVGLWGLASFATAQRVREIGIRKTLGASSAAIVRLLVAQFMRPVLIANVVAWPLALFAARKWLAGFGDRVPLSWWYFVAASLVAVTIAVLTVSGQAWRASRTTPAASLRHE